MNPFFAASGLESLITIAIFLGIAVVSAWLKRKQQADDDTETWPAEPHRPTPPARPLTPTPRPQVPRPTKPASWEEELRKLLEGDEPAPQPPPVIVYETPRPRPPPAAPPPVPRRAPVIIREADDEMERGLPVHLPSLTQSGQAYKRASQLDVSMAEHLRQISEKVTTHAPAMKRLPPALHPAFALIRNRASLQSAIVASLILGPPKALEGQP